MKKPSRRPAARAAPAPRHDPRYWTGAHTTHRLRYHVVLVPKYRKRVLEGPVATRLEELLRQACAVHGWEAEELAIQNDHVHLLVQVSPRFSVAQIMQTLKGGTRRALRAAFPSLTEHLWGASFWSEGYVAATVGVVEGSVIEQYIRAQRG